MDNLYKNRNKFDVIKNNFTFKLNVFYNKYLFIYLLLDIYFQAIFIMLTSQIQIYFYANYDFIILFKYFY